MVWPLLSSLAIHISRHPPWNHLCCLCSRGTTTVAGWWKRFRQAMDYLHSAQTRENASEEFRYILRRSMINEVIQRGQQPSNYRDILRERQEDLEKGDRSWRQRNSFPDFFQRKKVACFPPRAILNTSYHALLGTTALPKVDGWLGSTQPSWFQLEKRTSALLNSPYSLVAELGQNPQILIHVSHFFLLALQYRQDLNCCITFQNI